MTPPAQPRIAEGVIVLAAAALMAAGLGGVVWWQSRPAAPGGAPARVGPAAPAADPAGEAPGADAARAELEQALAAARQARDAAEADARAAEEARVEAVAKVELELDAYRRQVAELETENERLTAEVGDLQQKVLRLVDEVESASAAGTEPERPAPLTAGPGPNEVSPRALNAARVVDANQALRYVVLDVGSAQGVRPGMRFSVLDGDQVVAQLRAEDVRETMSGAVVEPVPGARFPAPNDRAIVTRHVEE